MDWLFEKLGFQQLTEEEKSYLTTVAAETIRNRLIARIADHIGNGQVALVRDLFEKNDETAVTALCDTHKIDFDQLIDEEIVAYAEELGRAKEALTGSEDA